MSGNNESSFVNDIFETRTRIKAKDEAPLSDESTTSLIGMEIGPFPPLAHLCSGPDIASDIEVFDENIDQCIASSLIGERWRQQDLKILKKLNDFFDEMDLLCELEFEFEEFPDSDEDDESVYSDGLEDSIRLTKYRFCKRNELTRIQNVKAKQDCGVE